ncbi:MAG TPA: carboxypeptidase-like regulatory domain-containing protein [Vicinamibacterales bacterium]|nr:carboxypeptidase-like regulatory domain-containing protein [Vicinamibacterales bacterium]
MKHRLMRVIAPLLCLATITSATMAYGQVTTSLSGTVTDTSGAVLPGADVVAKADETGTTFTAVTNERGLFNIPGMQIGRYTVTVSLQGFKTVALSDIRLNTATAAEVNVKLELGQLSETVTVKSGTEVVQTQTNTLGSTLTTEQITKLPLVTRDTLWGAVPFLAGVDTTTGPRASTINGLPSGAINISIDGVNTQDNNNRSATGTGGGCGFFSLISPRLDAVEEVTIATAAQGAESAGQGAVQIKYTTRSGTNQYTGSAYFYDREPKFNSNYWFNNRDQAPDPATGKAPKDQVKVYQPGFRLGGPIQIPGLYDGHDKAFFFFNYEQFRQPTQISRTRRILTPDAQQGLFTYGSTTVNLLNTAAANGQTATIDPTIKKLLADIYSSTSAGTLKARTDPNTLDFNYQADAKQLRQYPTWRVDYNLTTNNRLSYTSYFQKYESFPDTLNNADPRFPGFPVVGEQNSNRWNWNIQARSTIGKNLVNQFLTGYTASHVYFFTQITPDKFGGVPVGDQAGFNLNIGSFATTNNNDITTATASTAPQQRENPTIDVSDTVTWLKGAHNISFGGQFTHIGLWAYNQTVVPQINFGMATGDAADAMFNTTNFPNASSTNLADARALYSVLTGRITAINANARLDETTGKYVYLAPGVQRGQLHELGGFIQDQWRARDNLTINAGLRYEYQFPFVSRNDSYATATVADIWGVSGVGNLFKPGTLTGKVPEYQNLTKNTNAYKADVNNLAPTLGLTFRPSSQKGLFRSILGNDGDTVLRAAYTLAYSRGGMGDFTAVYGNNPGITITTNRTQALNNLVVDNQGLPLLLSQTSRLGAPVFQEAPVYPNSGIITDQIRTFDPNLQTPYAQSYTAGWQRALTRNTALEIRYVGTRFLQSWTDYNFNEINIKENGFLDEFRKAQANLQANIAAGRGNTFAYTGAPGTSPLPIFLGAYNAQPASKAGDTTAYTGTNWTNTTNLGLLSIYNPNPGGAINGANNNSAGFASLNTTFGLVGNATFRDNLIKAGYPSNLFIANPDKNGGAQIRGNGGGTRYDSLQVEMRRRLSKGLLIEGNYVLGKQQNQTRYSFRVPREFTLDDGPRHAFKMNWVYELPFGRGRAFGSNVNSFVDRVIGGWEFAGGGRVQSGLILSFGNVRLVGMSDKDLQKVYKIEERISSSGKQLLFILPQDIIDNTIKAFSTSATSATGYGSLGPPSGRYFAPASGPDCIQIVEGDCAPREHYVTGPKVTTFDLSIVKRITLVGRTNFEFHADMINAFNNINFTPVAQTGSGATINQVTAAQRDVNNTQNPGGRLVQFVFRVTF